MTDDTAEKAPNLEVITDPTLEHGEWYFLQQPPKLKEWWIAPEQSNCERQVWNEDPSSYYPVTKGWLVHVIEKSAYDDLRAQRDRDFHDWTRMKEKLEAERNAALAELEDLKKFKAYAEKLAAMMPEGPILWLKDEPLSPILRTLKDLRAENERLQQNAPTAIIERENAIDELNIVRAERDRYREALEKIAAFHAGHDCSDISRKALSDSGRQEKSSASEPEGRAREQSE